MEAVPRFDEVLALGHKLVNELDMEPRVDTLARWMAHYVAELIDAAANAPLAERAACQKRCFDAILELWSHRAELPNGKRPFENLEPIMRALESLDPEDETPRFLRAIRSTIVEGNENSQTQSLLELVRNLDLTARIVIGYYLAEAARSSTDKSKDWVVLATEAGGELGGFDIVLEFVSSETRPDQSQLERELLQDRIKRLEIFTEMVTVVSDDLRVRLRNLPVAQVLEREVEGDRA